MTMHLPTELVRDAFRPPPPDELDLDAAAAPRRLGVPVEATIPEAVTDLAWFWNSNESQAPAQVTLADDYADLVARLMGSAGFSAGDRVVVSMREPAPRRKAILDALPRSVEAVDWPVGSELKPLLDGRTRMVLMSKACAVTGELLEVVPHSQLLAGTDILLVVEASHFASHGPLDVRRFRCDGVLLDGGDLFGAGGSAMWTKRPHLADPPAVSSGTASGLSSITRYVEALGEGAPLVVAPPSDRFGRREAMRRGMQGIRQDERVLTRKLLSGLRWIEGVRLLGDADPWRAASRIPVFAFVTWSDDAAVVKRLRAEGIRVEHGDLGAPEALQAYSVDPKAGAIRASLAHYHTDADVDRFLAALRRAV